MVLMTSDTAVSESKNASAKISPYTRFLGKIVCAAGAARAADLHHLYVMTSQNDVPFPWYERMAIQTRIWVFDRICGPIDN